MSTIITPLSTSRVAREEQNGPLRSPTNELFSAYPGRLSANPERYSMEATSAYGGHRADREQMTTRAGKFFGHPEDRPNFAPKVEIAEPQEKKPTTIQRFASIANRLISKSTKQDPTQLARKISSTLRRSPVHSPSTSRAPSCRQSTSEGLPTQKENSGEDEKLPKISSNPGEQMWLQARVEFVLNIVANNFLCEQNDEGRMSLESIGHVAKKWHNRNRPQPLDFMFDLKTQLKLTQLNAHTFVFYGPRTGGDIAFQSLMSCWKSIIRELTDRTFCLPDAALKKLMVDAFRVLEMLGGEHDAFLEFRNIQRQVNERAERAARRRAKAKAKKSLGFSEDHGVTRKVKEPLMVSSRGVVDDDEEFYNDGIFKG